MAANIGFEYQIKKQETPFETFLRYTDEKVKSSEVLAVLLKKIMKKGKIKLLDIGTGNGEYLKMALDMVNTRAEVDLTLLEPSEDLVNSLSRTIKSLSKNFKVKVVTSTWEDYESFERFDIILASHLYHIPTDEYFQQFTKIIKYLKSGGVLIFVLRKVDDPHRFKTQFKPLLFGEDFKAKTLDDALLIFDRISNTHTPLEIDQYESLSTLNIPYKENAEDTRSIIEFYLNKRWDDIPMEIQIDVMRFIADRKGVFNQVDGLAAIRKR